MTRKGASRSGRSRQGRYWLAATVAAIGVLGAIVWGGLVTAGAVATIEELPRGQAPGGMAIDIEDPGARTIYYERRTLTATTPLDAAIDVQVSGPDGEPIPVEPYDAAVSYRLWRLVGQAHATFEATTPGEHTIEVEGSAPEDATIAVAADAPTRLMARFLPPGLLVVAALVVAAVIALRDRTTSRMHTAGAVADPRSRREAAGSEAGTPSEVTRRRGGPPPRRRGAPRRRRPRGR